MEEQEKKEKLVDSLSERTKEYARVLRDTKDPYKAVKSYCAGNRWLEENAKAVGNWR